MKKIYLVLASISIIALNISAQPHLHIERNLEALRLDGSQSWLSFWDGPAYKGFLWNNQGNLTLGTTEFNANGQLKFVTNLAERMTIDQLGRVGVNTGSPLAPLHINHDNEALRISGAQSHLTFFNGLGSYAGYLWNKNLFDLELGTAASNSTGSLFLRTRDNLGILIDPDGLVGIRKAPTTELDVSGSIRLDNNLILGRPDNNDHWIIKTLSDIVFYFNGTYKCWIDTDGSFNTLSDIAVKNNIQSWNKNTLDHLSEIIVATYDYRDQPGHTSFGLIAQNLKEHFPEVVSSSVTTDGEEYLGIAYGKVSVIAIKAIQEQQEIIESQQDEISELKARLSKIELMLKNQ